MHHLDDSWAYRIGVASASERFDYLFGGLTQTFRSVYARKGEIREKNGLITFGRL
jgi:hypothetical protein